jgi:hypothetical protein
MRSTSTNPSGNMDGMRLTVFLILAHVAFAQPGLNVAKEYYRQTLSALQQVKTKDDLTKLVESQPLK